MKLVPLRLRLKVKKVNTEESHNYMMVNMRYDIDIDFFHVKVRF